MNNNKKLIQILEMHDEATENFGIAPQPDVSHEEWLALLANHEVKLAQITEEEFEEQKRAA